MVVEYLQTTAESIKVNKSARESPEQSADRVAFLSTLFHRCVPADLSDAVEFRREAASLQASGPAVYVAGRVGKERPWRSGALKVWAAMPLAERLKLQLL